jgi:hypothetical protein
LEAVAVATDQVARLPGDGVEPDDDGPADPFDRAERAASSGVH